MNIEIYLCIKYRVGKPTTMTKLEASTFGLPYPLRKGWLAVFGKRDITEAMAANLKIGMQARAVTSKSPRGKGYANAGASALATAIKQATWQPSPVDAIDSAFLSTYEWKRIRMQALKKYGARCQCCGARPSDNIVLCVDHIKPRRLFPELALDIKNLQILCGDCNHGKGNWDTTDWRNEGKLLEA